MKPTFTQLTAALTLLATLSSVGCATFKEEKSEKGEKSFFDRLPLIGKKDEEPEPYPNPAKVAATWTPDTLVQTGRTPTRGFGGRIFFYDEKSRPVPVEGTLIIHGFDDSAENEKDRVKRFEFTPEQLTRHYSQTDLGASYSVWIPWDAIGGERRRISLVTSFRTVEGAPVQGIPATIMLPGKSPELDDQEAIARLSPQYRRYLEASSKPAVEPSGLTTTTIARRRMSTPPAPEIGPKRGLTIPTVKEPEPMMATNSQTPSVDVQMIRKPRRTDVMPASAQIPVEWQR